MSDPSGVHEELRDDLAAYALGALDATTSRAGSPTTSPAASPARVPPLAAARGGSAARVGGAGGAAKPPAREPDGHGARRGRRAGQAGECAPARAPRLAGVGPAPRHGLCGRGRARGRGGGRLPRQPRAATTSRAPPRPVEAARPGDQVPRASSTGPGATRSCTSSARRPWSAAVYQAWVSRGGDDGARRLLPARERRQLRGGAGRHARGGGRGARDRGGAARRRPSPARRSS